MEHKGTVRLETTRLVLRRFRIEDTTAAFQNWTSDAKVTEYLRWPTHENIETTEAVLKMWIDGYQNNNFYQWAIVPKDNQNEPIGTIGVVDQKEELGICHIGYCIGSKWWNQGYTSEAFSAVIAFLFREVKAKRIESQHDPNNENSGKVMKKCGLTYEGTLRQADMSNKGIVDAAMYSILTSEF